MKTFTELKTIQDVTDFIKACIETLGLSFHPDTPFDDYVNWETSQGFFELAEIEKYDNLLSEAFDICEKEGKDIYEITMDIAGPLIQALENK